MPDLKVLVVDDISINTMLVADFLERFAIETDSASNGEDAVKMCIKHQYDLIFMNTNMPTMDGITATKSIRANKDLSHQPFTLVCQLTFCLLITENVSKQVWTVPSTNRFPLTP